MKTLLTIVIAVYSVLGINALPTEVSRDRYRKCSKGSVNSMFVNPIDSRSARSPLDCLQMCSQTPECSGANICPTGHNRQVNCSLTKYTGPEDCVSAVTDVMSHCYFAYKTQKTTPAPQARDETTTTWTTETTPAPQAQDETTTTLTTETTTTTQEPTPGSTELWCQNGGSLNGDKCDCPVEYGGSACERRIRDCTEAYDNGHHQDGTYHIQPVTAPNPFQVYCWFDYGGVTIVFEREDNSDVNRDWLTYKTGFGHPNSLPYFIGLDNLHHLTKQAAYELNIWMEDDWHYYIGGAMYDNFTFGPESTSYAISFSNVHGDDEFDDWFLSSLPVKFSASGHDVNGCFSQKGKAGWYGNDCTGYGMFTTGNFYWPRNGENKALEEMAFELVRKSAFYD